jgi:class 3 adenylate cyclase
MPTEHSQLETAISAMEMQRVLLGDALVDAALGPMRARLAQLSADQQLKHVTILFLDIVGSTAFSQQLDPEDVHLVMDSALQAYTCLIEQHGGKVLKYAGDSVLAVFGANVTQEDDAERAVRAGLALLAEGSRQQQGLEARFGRTEFSVRVGLHTGSVLLGGGVDAQNNIRGFHVNVAARMEQSAPVGGLRISHDTYQHVRGIFDVMQQAPIDVKGVSEPMVTYLVSGLKPHSYRMATRGIDGVNTRMVGRESELKTLQTAFLRLLTERHGSAVHVVAEAGMGKSRLLHEFENWAHSQARPFCLLQGRAHAVIQSQPYGLIRDVLARKFAIADSDSAGAARKKFECGIADALAEIQGQEMALSHAHILGHLIGLDFADSRHVRGILDDSRQIYSRGLHAAALWFRSIFESQEQPLLLMLDDVHWSDKGSLDFLIQLGQVSQDLPLLTLAFSRPVEEDLLIAVGADATLLNLGPLDNHFSRLLANEMLKRMPSVPTALQELLIGGAEGNPFYMEELVKMLIDEGAIVTHSAGWDVRPEKLRAAHVPTTLTGVLQARLDRLQPQEKRVLQQASVLGSVFSENALLALNPDAAAPLTALTQHALLMEHAEMGTGGVREFAFSHHLLHQVTYDTLLKRNRKELHACAASWFATLAGAGSKDFLGLAAQHFLKADDPLQASHYFTGAAEYAGSRYALEDARAYIAQAWSQLAPGNRQGKVETNTTQHLLRWRLLCIQEATLDLEGNRDEQEIRIDMLRMLAEDINEDSKRSEVALRKSNFAMRAGDFLSMQRAAQQSMEWATRTGNATLALRGQQRLSLALAYLGNCAHGRALAQDGLQKTRALGARALEALYCNALSVIADTQADQVACLEFDEQDLLINRELGNRRNEAIALSNLGLGWLKLGDNLLAKQYLAEGLQLARAVGDRGTEPSTLVALSVLALRQGDPPQALTLAQTATDLSVSVHSPDIEAIALCALGNACLALARVSAAQLAFERAHLLASQLETATRLDALAGMASVALEQGDRALALPFVDQLLSQTEQCESLEGAENPSQIRLTCYQVLARAGDGRAGAVLETASSRLMAVASSIQDPALRQHFLYSIPEHALTVHLWESSGVRMK